MLEDNIRTLLKLFQHVPGGGEVGWVAAGKGFALGKNLVRQQRLTSLHCKFKIRSLQSKTFVDKEHCLELHVYEYLQGRQRRQI